mmetsp:Transcript_29104/g.53070  ORF Transcript_29104/g.53070 Transcript_29104/m.53070 type:complete len:80 (+) Transcript_29104:60-299(+)
MQPCPRAAFYEAGWLLRWCGELPHVGLSGDIACIADSGYDISLPATKIRTGELPRQAWERLLRKKMRSSHAPGRSLTEH